MAVCLFKSCLPGVFLAGRRVRGFGGSHRGAGGVILTALPQAGPGRGGISVCRRLRNCIILVFGKVII